MRGVSLLAILGVLLSCPAVGHGQQQPPCGRDGDSGYEACVIANARSLPAERYRDSREELIRAFVFKGVRKVPPIVIVEVVLPKEGPAQLSIKDPIHVGYERSYPIDREKFPELRTKLALMPSVAGNDVENNKDGVETVCLDPASGLVETVFDGKVGRAEFDYCQSEAKYIDDILDFAAPIDPACAPLVSYDGWPADALRECLHLEGSDRLSAGNAYLASEKLRDKNSSEPISHEATLIFDGKKFSGSAATAQIEQLLNRGADDAYYCWPTDATAFPDHVVVRGACEHIENSKAGNRQTIATTNQVWKLDANGKLALSEWRIDRFRPLAD